MALATACLREHVLSRPMRRAQAYVPWPLERWGEARGNDGVLSYSVCGKADSPQPRYTGAARRSLRCASCAVPLPARSRRQSVAKVTLHSPDELGEPVTAYRFAVRGSRGRAHCQHKRDDSDRSRGDRRRGTRMLMYYEGLGVVPRSQGDDVPHTTQPLRRYPHPQMAPRARVTTPQD